MSRMSHPLLSAGTRLLGLLLPAGCLACGRSCGETAPRSPALSLCPACRGRLPVLAPPLCDVCALPLDETELRSALCRRCLAAPPAFDRLLALWRYEPPITEVIHGLKFHRLDYLGRHLAFHLAAGLARELVAACGEVVVPVPLGWRRQLLRGYNQAACIARPLASELGLPLCHALARRRATSAQSRLSREARGKNLAGAFRVRRPGAVDDRAVLLVDDVATTGATLHAAARALKEAGAASVTAVVAARTPFS